jgi:hypothetical protein
MEGLNERALKCEAQSVFAKDPPHSPLYGSDGWDLAPTVPVITSLDFVPQK